jgi:hypothetical protein
VRFGREQIDAIATAIYAYEEKGNAIIIADQTGVGKGRTAAGLIRYAILELGKKPFFFTEKKHLINDIYRDLYDIGFDAGVVEVAMEKEEVRKDIWTDEELIKYIISDLKDIEDVRVEYSFPDEEKFSVNKLKSYPKKLSEEDTEYYENIMSELIELYRTKFNEEGTFITKKRPVPLIEQEKALSIAQKEGRMKLTPFFPSKEDIFDKNGNVIYKAMTEDELKDAMGYKKEQGKWTYDYDQDVTLLNLPKKYELFVMPYSQISNLYEDVKKTGGRQVLNPKIAYLQNFVNNSVVILDESHSASGGTIDNPSNIFETISKFVGLSAMTTYISATYSKRAVNMPLYAIKTSMRETGLSTKELIETFTDGDTALQEAVSVELVRNGQLLRRERLIQGTSNYEYAKNEPGDQVGTQQAIRMNTVADLFGEVRQFQKKVHGVIKSFKDELEEREFPTEPLAGTKDEIDKARSINGLEFQMFNFFLLGLKIQQTVEYSLEQLKNGVKPIITVANTLESALSNMPKSFKTMKESDRYQMGDEIENDFKLYIAYLLFYTMRWKQNIETVADDGTRVISAKTICVFDDYHPISRELRTELGGEYEVILGRILRATTGVSIAPIDEIKQRIKDAGYSINEITGRQLQVSFSNKNFDKGVITKREVKPTTVVVKEYNENKIDALIINQSGAVGISMHARPVGRAKIFYPIQKTQVEVDGVIMEVESGWPTTLENKDEVKKRGMIITQMELDINKEVQKLGRINRTGQVYPPQFTYIVSSIPSESRLSAMMERKLRSLSANVSSDQEQSSHLFSSDDFFSAIAIDPFNETMREIGARFRAKVKEDIKNYTKILYFSDFQLQKNFYDIFTQRLREFIEEQIKLGTYVGALAKKDYKAKTVDKFPFYIGNEDSKTSFGGHSFLEQCTVKEYEPKNLEREVRNAIASKMVLKNSNFYKKDSNPQLDEEGEVITSSFDKMYDNLEMYQADAIALIDSFADDKATMQITYIAEYQKDILALQEKVDNAKNELFRKYDVLKFEVDEQGLRTKAKRIIHGKVKEIFELEEQVSRVKKQISEIKDKISEALNKEDMASVGTLSVDMAKYKEEDKRLSDLVASYGDVSELKSEYKSSEREIKHDEKEIEKIKNRISNIREQGVEYATLMNNVKSFIMKIGQVHNYCILKEIPINVDKDGEVQLSTQRYEYEIDFSQPAVVTGVTFPFEASEFIPSNIIVNFVGVTDKSTGTKPFSQLFKEIDIQDKWERNRKSLIELKLISPSYKDNVWNKIVGSFDTSSDAPKYFIVGSILKTFMLAKDNELPGTITKYTMNEGVDRLGIEISNNTDTQGTMVSTTYDKLLSRYNNEEGSLEYPILFDGNTKNIDRLMTNYMYWYCIARFYNAKKNNKQIAGDYNDNYLNNGDEFTFEISSKSGYSAIRIAMPYSLREDSNNICSAYFDGEVLPQQMAIEDFTESLTVQIISSELRYAEFFAYQLNQLGVDIDSDNLEISKRSLNFPDVSVSTNQVKRYSLDKLFKLTFPTNILGAKTSIACSQRVKMSYDNFLQVMKALEVANEKPTFATGSQYFKEVANMYVLEQFVENSVFTETSAGGDVTFNPAIEGELMEAIDSQIQKIVDIFTLEE